MILMKIKIKMKLLRIISLLVAVLAINLHMVIPHDHHQAELFTANSDDCPASHNDTGHNSGLPIHCNAFNDLASEKTIIPGIIRHVECKFFLTVKAFDPDELCLYNLRTDLPDLSVAGYDSDCQDITLLRAPPSLI
jgi:hypothetical protein